MSSHRLFIDIPLSFTEEEAIKKSKMILDLFVEHTDALRTSEIFTINYRLGHDEDRQTSNYFIKTDSGHVSNKKCRITIDSINGQVVQ